MPIYKIIIYLAFILFIYRLISHFFSVATATSKKKNKSGKEIDYKDADFEEID